MSKELYTRFRRVLDISNYYYPGGEYHSCKGRDSTYIAWDWRLLVLWQVSLRCLQTNMRVMYHHCGYVGSETVQHHFRRKSKTYTECNEKDHLILGQFQAPQKTNAQFNIPAVDCTQEKLIKVWNSFWLVKHLTLTAESISLRQQQPQRTAKFVMIV